MEKLRCWPWELGLLFPEPTFPKPDTMDTNDVANGRTGTGQGAMGLGPLACSGD